MRPTDYTPPSSAGRATVYGPAVLGTVQVTDPHAIAALAGLRAPDLPRPPPIAAPPVPRVSRLTIVGALLAILLPPLGLVLSAIALTRILEVRPRPPSESLAVLGIAASVLTLAAAFALAAS